MSIYPRRRDRPEFDSSLNSSVECLLSQYRLALSFLRNVIFGGSRFRRMPKPSSKGLAGFARHVIQNTSNPHLLI